MALRSRHVNLEELIEKYLYAIGGSIARSNSEFIEDFLDQSNLVLIRYTFNKKSKVYLLKGSLRSLDRNLILIGELPARPSNNHFSRIERGILYHAYKVKSNQYRIKNRKMYIATIKISRYRMDIGNRILTSLDGELVHRVEFEGQSVQLKFIPLYIISGSCRDFYYIVYGVPLIKQSKTYIKAYLIDLKKEEVRTASWKLPTWVNLKLSELARRCRSSNITSATYIKDSDTLISSCIDTSRVDTYIILNRMGEIIEYIMRDYYLVPREQI